MIDRRSLRLWLAAALCLIAGAARAQEPTFGPELQGFNYPWPVHDFAFSSQGEPLTMRYMDVAAVGTPNGRTVVLLHGKNFCAATWERTINALADRGYRVIAPDQIGFCKSSKPERYQYSFQALAENTHGLVASLRIKTIVLIGHSTGGMLAARYALMYPDELSTLVLVNPIGLEDWKALGVPALSVDRWIERERAPPPNASAPMSNRPTTPASGAPDTTGGSRCSPGSCKGRGARSSPATPGSSTT